MKKITLLLVSALVALSACSKKTAYESTETATSSQTVTETGEKAPATTGKENQVLQYKDVAGKNAVQNSSYVATEQLKYSKRIESTLDQVNQTLKAMKDKAAESGTQLKQEIEATTKSFEDQKDQIQKQYNQLKSAKTAWSNVKGEWQAFEQKAKAFLETVQTKLQSFQGKA